MRCVVLFSLACALGCTRDDDARTRVRIAGSTGGGGLAGLAVGVYKIIKLHLPELKVGPPQGTGGSVENARLLGLGEIDFAYSSELGEAYSGTEKWVGERYDTLRTVYTFPFGPQQVITLASSGIKSFRDLRGKRICVGPAGSGGANRAELVVLPAHGLERGRDYQISWLTYGGGCDALRDGSIDALVIGMPAPTPAVMELAALNEIYLVPLDADAVKRIVEDNPKLGPGEIPPDVYGENQKNTEPIATLELINAFGTNAHVPDEVVYKVTRAHWEHIAEFHKASDIAKQVSLDAALNALPAPLHPGAERYYREIGLWPRE